MDKLSGWMAAGGEVRGREQSSVCRVFLCVTSERRLKCFISSEQSDVSVLYTKQLLGLSTFVSLCLPYVPVTFTRRRSRRLLFFTLSLRDLGLFLCLYLQVTDCKRVSTTKRENFNIKNNLEINNLQQKTIRTEL